MQRTDAKLFKEKLIEVKTELLNNSVTATHQSPKLDKGDDADMALSEIHQNLSFQLRERERQLIQKIDRALAKIDEGRYGLCEECEEPLEKKRLIARPFATLCISCKEEQEHLRRVYA